MRFLVTGGAGFVGSHLVELLLADEATSSVRVLDDLSTGHLEWLDADRDDPRLDVVVGSVLDETRLDDVCREIDVVFHLACLGLRQGFEAPSDNYRVNAEGALRVALAARRARIRRLLHVSSSDVYGAARSLPIDEGHQVNPLTVYAAGKLAGETAARTVAATSDIELVVVRPTNLYGPRCHVDDETGELIPRTIVRVLAGIPPVVHGTGNQTRDYVHVRDAARAMQLLAGASSANGLTVNIGTGHERSINEVVSTIAACVGIDAATTVHDAGRGGDVERRSVDGGLLAELTGFAPATSFADGVAGVVAWLASAPERSATAPIPLTRPLMDGREAAAVAEVIASGWIAEGPRVAELETALCTQVGAEHGIALSSGTAALHLALVALGIGPGDEVVVPSLSFIATANAVRYVGATPIFADVCLTTQNLTAATVSDALSPRTRAVIVVHQAGIPADLDELRAVCEDAHLGLVEDAACALGSRYDGAPIGGHSDLVAFSFHARKSITTGEGGMLMTSRDDWATRLRGLRSHGSDLSAIDRHTSNDPRREHYLEVGFNHRMSDLQAAVGLVQLDRLDAVVAERRRLGARYREALSDVCEAMAGDTPRGRNNYQSFWLLLPNEARGNRDEVLRTLNSDGVMCKPGIMAAHLEPAYAEHEHGLLPATELLTSASIILPLFAGMSDSQHERVVESLRKALR